jgi:uncharacterized membrane protein YjfL (UPF0719 family)
MHRYVAIILYIVTVLAFLFISKKIADLLTGFNDDEVIEKEGNTAVAFRRFGLYIGTSLGLAGVASEGISLNDYLPFCLSGGVILLLFFLAHFLNDFVVARKINNNQLLRAGNKPVGIVEAGNFIAVGILLNGAFSGAGGGVAAAIVFFFAGQLLIILSLLLHQRLYRFNLTDEIEKGNLSAGISVAGTLVAYSIILRSSISGDFTGWAEGFASFIVVALTGIAAILIFQKVGDLLFLPRTTYDEEIRKGNSASIMLAQGVTLALSIAISHIIWH